MTINDQFGDADAQAPPSHEQKEQTAGSNMAGTDSAVGSSWA
jgi:hypothetical protein